MHKARGKNVTSFDILYGTILQWITYNQNINPFDCELDRGNFGNVIFFDFAALAPTKELGGGGAKISHGKAPLLCIKQEAKMLRLLIFCMAPSFNELHITKISIRLIASLIEAISEMLFFFRFRRLGPYQRTWRRGCQNQPWESTTFMHKARGKNVTSFDILYGTILQWITYNQNINPFDCELDRGNFGNVIFCLISPPWPLPKNLEEGVPKSAMGKHHFYA